MMESRSTSRHSWVRQQHSGTRDPGLFRLSVPRCIFRETSWSKIINGPPAITSVFQSRKKRATSGQNGLTTQQSYLMKRSAQNSHHTVNAVTR